MRILQTPLVNVLNAIHGVLEGKGKVITVVGAGGNRDKGKRPIMAKESARLSDRVIITSDNPRFEEPQDIINDMLAGLDKDDMQKTISITDRREKELSDLGFIALIYRKNSDKAAFFSGQTVHKPPVYTSDTANANARISARLPYLLNASRFAHYVKANMRDKVGSFMTADNVSKYLNNWISQYVLLSDDAGDDIKARYPLREARVDVSEDPGNPGAYKCVIFLRPHFQLEELTASIRLVAELPPPAV